MEVLKDEETPIRVGGSSNEKAWQNQALCPSNTFMDSFLSIAQSILTFSHKQYINHEGSKDFYSSRIL